MDLHQQEGEAAIPDIGLGALGLSPTSLNHLQSMRLPPPTLFLLTTQNRDPGTNIKSQTFRPENTLQSLLGKQCPGPCPAGPWT